MLNEHGIFVLIAGMKKSRFSYNMMMRFWEMPNIVTPKPIHFNNVDGGSTRTSFGFNRDLTFNTTGTAATTDTLTVGSIYVQ